MKWSFNINQRAIKDNGFDIDLIDAAIFDLIKDFAVSESCRKTIENGRVYFWISWKLIVNQAPILKLTTRQSVYNRIENLVNCQLLDRHPQNKQLGQSWFCFGENYDKMVSYVPQNGSTPNLPPVNEDVQGIKQIPVNKNVQGVNKDLQGYQQEFTGGVNQNVQNTNTRNNLINNNTSTTPTTETPKENFKSENQKNETTPDSGPPPSYNWNNLRDVLLADEKFMIWAKMILRLDVKGVEDVILEYIVEQHGLGKRLNSDYKDLKAHIVNWGRIKISKEKETQKNQSNGNNSNRFRNPKNDGPTAIINRDDPDY